MMSRSLKSRLALTLATAVLVILFFVLRSLPAFAVSQVSVATVPAGQSVPFAVRRELSSMEGVPMIGLSTDALERRLSSLAVVDAVSVTKRFPSALEVSLTVASPRAVVSATDGDGEQSRLFLVRDGRMYEIGQEDWPLYRSVPIRVEVPEGYADTMYEFGMDEIFPTVMELASSLGANATLITRIKYDNNSSNSFGKMVLEFSSLNAQLWVREPVGSERLDLAISLILSERKDSIPFSEKDPLQYDLYARAMVRRL